MTISKKHQTQRNSWAVRERLDQLKAEGWTIAAIADELEVNPEVAGRWTRGTRGPAQPKVVWLALHSPAFTEPPPKRKRYS